MEEKKILTLKELVIGGTAYDTLFTSKFENRKEWKQPDERKVSAYIPGTIQKIMVKNGSEVDYGTPLLILEAMKMRNEVCSPVKGVVKKIHVAEGDQVAKSQLLLEIR